MKKLLIIAGILIAFLIATGFINAYATNENKKCQNVHGVFVDCSTVNNNIKNTDNSINNSNSNDIDNSSYNSNRNTNLNTAFGGDAKASAKATAGAAAIQSQSADNKGVTQTVVAPVTIVDTDITTIIDFNHISPTVGKTNADLLKTKSNQIKTSGIWTMILALTYSESLNMGKDVTDIKVFDSLLNSYARTGMISKAVDGVEGDVMGSVYFVPTGAKVTADGMFGKAMAYGMSNGATHFSVHKSSSGTYAEGSKAGIDVGGAASAVAKSDGSIVVAPGATFGFSKAWSSSEDRLGMLIIFMRDPGAVTPASGGKVSEYTSGR